MNKMHKVSNISVVVNCIEMGIPKHVGVTFIGVRSNNTFTLHSKIIFSN